MKIGAKIYCGFASVILIMSIVVGLSFWQLSRLTDAQAQMVNYEMAMKDQAQKLAFSNAYQAAASRGFMITGNQSYRTELNAATAEYEAALKYLNDNEKDPTLLAELNRMAGVFQPHIPNILKMLSENQRENAIEYLNRNVALDNVMLLREIEKYVAGKRQCCQTVRREL